MTKTKYLIAPREFTHKQKVNIAILTSPIYISDSRELQVHYFNGKKLSDLYFVSFQNNDLKLIVEDKPNEMLINSLKCLIRNIVNELKRGSDDSISFKIITHWGGEESQIKLISLCRNLEVSLREFQNIKVGYLSSNEHTGRKTQYESIISLLEGKPPYDDLYRILDECLIQDAESAVFDKDKKLKNIRNQFQKCLINRFLNENHTNQQAMQESQSKLTEAMKELYPIFTGFQWDADIDAIHNEYISWVNGINRQS